MIVNNFNRNWGWKKKRTSYRWQRVWYKQSNHQRWKRTYDEVIVYAFQDRMPSSINCHWAIVWQKFDMIRHIPNCSFKSHQRICQIIPNNLPVNSGLVYRSTGLVDIVWANELTIISNRHNTSASRVSKETSSRMASKSAACHTTLP